jgi:hypothetical protein
VRGRFAAIARIRAASFVSLLAAALCAAMLAGCASAKDDGPLPEVSLAETNLSSDMLRFGGPIAVQMAVEIRNATPEAITLHGLELRTVGGATFAMTAREPNLTRQLAPNETLVVPIQAWGRSSGGRLAADEPISLQGTAYFRSAAKGNFVRLFHAIVRMQ